MCSVERTYLLCKLKGTGAVPRPQQAAPWDQLFLGLRPAAWNGAPNTNYSIQSVWLAFLRQIPFGAFTQYIAGYFACQCFGRHPLF